LPKPQTVRKPREYSPKIIKPDYNYKKPEPRPKRNFSPLIIKPDPNYGKPKTPVRLSVSPSQQLKPRSIPAAPIPPRPKKQFSPYVIKPDLNYGKKSPTVIPRNLSPVTRRPIVQPRLPLQ
jgi:hypothetical protein